MSKKKKEKFKKARIPLYICLKLAIKNMWKKKFRFLIMIIICSISLAFLSFTIELSGDKLRQNVYTMVENGYNYTDIKEYLPLNKKSEKENFYNKYNSVNLSKDSYDTLKEEIPELVIHKYEEVHIDYAKKNSDIATSFYPGYIQTIIEYDSTNTYELLAGRLPTLGTKEILITDYLVYAFNHFDTLMDDGNYYDYLNKYISLNVSNNYKIVGIMKTNFDQWITETGFKDGNIDESNKKNFAYLNDFRVMNAVVLNKEYFDIEKYDTTGNITFTKAGKNRSEWLIVVNPDEESKNFIPDELPFTDTSVGIAVHRHNWQWVDTFGTIADHHDEINIPKNWVESIFGIKYDDLVKSQYDNLIHNQKLQITITPSNKDKTITKTYRIVGITDSDNLIALSNDELDNIKNYSQPSELVLVKLPNSGSEAYKLFNKVYQKGYVIDVWKYHNDIDSYVVDPFVNILSKAGLVVFISFTIGIMWTIITIEIVDSKKEIGILRSIGLSGIKVSTIFIIQSLIVNLIAYGISIVIANQFIQFYNANIMDELNLITLNMYMMTYRTPVYLLVFVVLITLVSTFMPLYKIMSQKIIDVINERE